MTAREYLQTILDAGKRIQIKQDEVKRLHESLTSLSISTDKEQVSHTRNVSLMSDTISRIVDMEHEIDQQLNALYSLHREAAKYFDHLRPEYAKVLIDRYIRGMTIPDLMKTYNYCRRNVYRIIDSATNELQMLFNKLGEENIPTFERIHRNAQECTEMHTLSS